MPPDDGRGPLIEDDLKNEDDHKNEDDLKNEDDIKNEDNPKMKMTSKIGPPLPPLKKIPEFFGDDFSP